MSLRDRFEAWVIQHPHNKGLSRVQKYPSVPVAVSDAYADPSVELAWQAYQAGYEASGRDELLAALESLLVAVETMKCPQNVYDVAMLVIRFAAPIDHARSAIKKARGET